MCKLCDCNANLTFFMFYFFNIFWCEKNLKKTQPTFNIFLIFMRVCNIICYLNELLPFSVNFDLTFPLVLFPILILHKNTTEEKFS